MEEASALHGTVNKHLRVWTQPGSAVCFFGSSWGPAMNVTHHHEHKADFRKFFNLIWTSFSFYVCVFLLLCHHSSLITDCFAVSTDLLWKLSLYFQCEFLFLYLTAVSWILFYFPELYCSLVLTVIEISSLKLFFYCCDTEFKEWTNCRTASWKRRFRLVSSGATFSPKRVVSV